MVKTGTKEIRYTMGAADKPVNITVTATTSPTYMHSYSSSNCASQASDTNVIKNVYDYRDTNDYSVRYMNGACWMTQNLRFSGTSINSSYTDINTSKTITWYDLGTEGASSGKCGSANGYSYACKHSPNSTNDSTALNQYTADQIGVYYNYMAASALSVTSSSNSTTSIYSLCPKNWGMPSYIEGNVNSGDVYGLRTDQNLVDADSFEPVLGGYYYNNKPSYVTTYGNWWTTVASGDTYRRRLYYVNKGLTTSDAPRYYGYYLRCVLGKQTSLANATYMQDVTNVMVDNISIGSVKTLLDKRDDKEYSVAKLADGKLWMTDNIDIAGGTILTPTNTDFTQDYLNGYTGDDSGLIKNGTTGLKLPASSSDGFNEYDTSFVYNTGRTNCRNRECYSYYSWDAATLGSGRSITTNNINVPYSLCPKGWKLPNTRSGTDSSSNVRALMVSLGGSSNLSKYTTTTSPLGETLSNTLRGAPYYFLLSGDQYSGESENNGEYGYYWTSTAGTTHAKAYVLELGESSVASTDYYRKFGFAVRCLFAG